MATVHSTQVDPRGLRFAAAITSVVLATALIVPSPVREALLVLQAIVFAVGIAFGVGKSPYASIYRRLVRPRLGPPTGTEDARPPRFAQLVGLIFVAGALLALVAGAETVGLVLIGFALIAAALNATVGLCLGCEMYLVYRRVAGHPSTS